MVPGFIALLAGPAILIPLAWYSLRRRHVPGATWYGILLLTIAFWSLAYAWEVTAAEIATKTLALKVKYLGIALVPSGWLAFMLSFVGTPAAQVRTRVLPVALISGALLVLAWTDHWHGWFWGPLTTHEIAGYTLLRGRGPGFWVNVVYTYGVLAAGMVVLASHAVHSPYLYKKRARILVAGAIVPWAGNLFFVANLRETTLDPTPFLFSCTAVIAAIVVFRYELFDPVPTLKEARIATMGDGIVILDGKQRIADLNHAAEAFLGVTRAAVAGTPFSRLVPQWPDGPCPTSPLDVTINQGADARVFDMRANPIHSRAGELTGAVIVLRDVTDQRAAERALRESELRYRTVIEQASDGVWVANLAGTIVDVNPGACSMLGYARNELIGRPVEQLLDGDKADGGVVLRRRRGDTEPIDWQRRVVAKDGRRLLLAGRSSQIAPDLIVSTFRDITRERAEAEYRERLLRDAHGAIRIKDEFLATLSHELRTPIAAVLGWARMLARGDVEPERVAHALAVIQRNALAQARLVDDLLDVSQMDGGRLRLAVAETDLAVVVGEAVDAVRPSAQANGLTVEAHLPPALPHIMVDAGRIQQVLWNLLTNAIKFTPRGGTIVVSVEVTPEEIELTVRDTGRGIPREFLPYVFDPFRQAEGGASRGVSGLGLGLAIVRRIIEAHGGHVEAMSDGPGTGATFRVHLPAATVKVVSDQEPRAASGDWCA